MIKGLRYYNAYLKDKRLFKEAGIGDRDVFLASFPKSGNTWLRYILARALYPESQINQENLQHYFPTVYRNSTQEIKKLSSPRYIKTHSAFFSLYPKCIYIIRDYRQVILSAWHHAKNKSNYMGSLDEFVDSKMINAFGPWFWHVTEALNFQESAPEKMLILRYESMLSDPAKSVNEILKFTNLQPIIPVEEIVEKTSFVRLQTMEKQGGQNPEQLFFRSGTNDDWKKTADWVLENKLLDKPTHEVMKRCGYI